MTRNPRARDARSSGSTPAARRRNHQAGVTDRDVDKKTLEVRHGSMRVKALDGLKRPADGVTLAELTACVQEIFDRFQGRR